MRLPNFAPTRREVGPDEKGGDFVNMTQDEINALVTKMTSNGGDGFKEVEGHLLACAFCRQILFSEDLNMHVILTRRGCDRSEYGHMYISEGRLRQMRERPYIAGWRVKEKPVSKIVKRKVVAVDGKGGAAK